MFIGDSRGFVWDKGETGDVREIKETSIIRWHFSQEDRSTCPSHRKAVNWWYQRGTLPFTCDGWVTTYGTDQAQLCVCQILQRDKGDILWRLTEPYSTLSQERTSMKRSCKCLMKGKWCQVWCVHRYWFCSSNDSEGEGNFSTSDRWALRPADRPLYDTPVRAVFWP